MGLIAKILDSFTGSDGEPSAKVEVYKDDNATARVFNPPGVDARPIDGDACYIEDSQDTEGGKDVLGFINDPVSGKGEIRIVSRDSGGNVKASIHVKADGSIEIEAPGNMTITAPLSTINGNVQVNGTIDATKNISSEMDVIGDSAGDPKSLNTHPHMGGNLSYDVGLPIGSVTGAVNPKPAGAPSGDGAGNIDMNGLDLLNVKDSVGGQTNHSSHGHEQGADSGTDTEVKTNGPS